MVDSKELLDNATECIIIDICSEEFLIDSKKIKRIAASACRRLGFNDFELSLSFVDGRAIQELNSQYRSKNESTDVLSFPQHEWPSPILINPSGEIIETSGCIAKQESDSGTLILGDIVISLEDAWRNAQDIGQGLDREACFLIVHGLLHLCGHDHMETLEEELMLDQQRQLMAYFAKGAKTPLWTDCVKLKTGLG